ncbi:MAG: DUF4974 domain-containing protein [Odoribacteraceae bacterium]|jgi:ferric-dicitrate binding protein FerR (iron transport regulator)|nr:DUF4974 domain-containing protein [Odoribacteraceae bacterium]
MNEEIMIWIADYCAGTISKAHFEALGKWIESSPQHREEFRKLLRAHRATLELTLVDHLDHSAAWRRLVKSFIPMRRGRWRRPGWAVAAACVAGISLLTWIGIEVRREEGVHPVSALPGALKATLSLPGGEEITLERHVTLALSKEALAIREDSILLVETREEREEHLLSVPRGGEYQLTLADGTRIWLNSDTRLRFPFPFTGGTREVYLEGEAYFEVQREEGRPFIVRTDLGSVNVLGTAFNISAYPENRDIVTTLVTGMVEISVAERLIRLTPGNQAIWQQGREQVEVRAVDVSCYTSWMKGLFEFEDTSLKEILAYLARWYNVSFAFANEEIAALRFTGGAKKYRPLEEFLQGIERACEVKFSMKESVIYVSSKN